jgi:hypothetical protein
MAEVSPGHDERENKEHAVLDWVRSYLPRLIQCLAFNEFFITTNDRMQS